MAAPSSAQGPTTPVTEVPGRFSPILIVDKRNIANVETSTATQGQLAYLPRTETASNEFNVPLTDVTELGTDFNVGDFDDIPDNKITMSVYDVGPLVMSILTSKQIGASGTTTWGFNDLNAAPGIDVIRQYADPNGNIFTSEYMQDHVVEEYDASLKAKAASMEQYTLVGFTSCAFRGFIQAKSYVVQTGDVTANAIDIASILGANEAPYQIPQGSISSIWNQMGCKYFLKIERWRPGTGFVRFKEGTVASGVCSYTSGSTTLAFEAGDLAAGDVFLFTYATYETNVASMSTLSGITGSYSAIPQTTLDTSDPIAVPTRLTPITISAANVSRGQQFDLKLTLKRDRAEGIGDVTGMYGPSDAPAVALTLDVKMTDFGLNSIMQAGTPDGSDDGGSTANDFFSPELVVRNQLATAAPVVVTILDPRNSSNVLKTVTSPTAVWNQRSVTTPNKGAATVKYTGKDYVGNITVSVTKS